MCEITNVFVLQYFDYPYEVSETSRFNNWFDCTVDKTKANDGLHKLVEVCKKPCIPDDWSIHRRARTPGFREIMSRNRYQLIGSFLHFGYSEERVLRGKEGYDL